MSVFGFCKNKCKHDVYTVEETNDLLASQKTTITNETDEKLKGKSATSHTHSDYKVKGDFAVVSGTLSEGAANVSLPSGFTSTNCVITSIMTKNPSQTDVWGTGTTFDSSSYVGGCLPIRAYMTNGKLVIQAKNINLSNDTQPYVADGGNFEYKVILMKV